VSRGTKMEFDVLVITALREELNAVLALTETKSTLAFADPTTAEWSEARDSWRFPYYYREFTTESDGALVVGAAWTGAMGETATADKCRALVADLDPLCVAMTGICAGRRNWMLLGDVIVASRLFSYDHGKYIATSSDDGLFRDIETYNLERTWAMDATVFTEDLAWLNLILGHRPLSIEVQKAWVLQTLLSHVLENKPEPQSHPDREKCCPRWVDVLTKLRESKLIILRGGVIEFTKKGREQALNYRTEHPDGPEPDRPFKAHVGPIATGKAVVQDPGIFPRIEKFERNVMGLEMEGAAIGYVAENVGIPSIVVKGVSDYADNEKDDSCRVFAERASAAFLIGFLKKHPPRSLRRMGALKRHALPVLVSEKHVAELHDIAKRKVKWFSWFLEPAWGVHAITPASADAEEELVVLRKHFPQFNSLYSKWYALNAELCGVPTLWWEEMGVHPELGYKPTTAEGKNLLRKHNEVVRDLIAELIEIQLQSSISGECDYCKKKAPTKKGATKKGIPAKKVGAAKKAATKTAPTKEVNATKN
jgi:nucleoside phosphorylase